MAYTEPEQLFPRAKKPRSMGTWPHNSVNHKDWLCASMGLESLPNYLQQLYPHEQDDVCILDEVDHVYHVNGIRYKYSASDVVHAFFPQFDKELSYRLIEIAERSLRNLECSVYWLYMYLILIEDLGGQQVAFDLRVKEVFNIADNECSRTMHCTNWNLHQAHNIMTAMLQQKVLCKPAGRACYFLARCAGCSGKEIQTMWDQLGKMEALKGTILHKQIELYMQELGRWQLDSGKRGVPLSDIPEEILHRTRQAASAPAAMLRVVGQTSSKVWDQWCTRAYLLSCVEEMYSNEFQKFEVWLKSKPTFSPYRSEWSLYHDGFKVAGQLDALWFQEPCVYDSICMVDWKRSRRFLSADPDVQYEQSYNQMGIEACDFAPHHSNPCARWHNCAYNHYCVQQNLYAYFLKQKYNIVIQKSLLVQCHPDIVGHVACYNEVEVKVDTKLAMAILESFIAGWHCNVDSCKT